MRIIAGRFRRRQLLSNPGLVTRPITDRVKETLFENIEQRLLDRRVADLFAGTGTIGLEALSRGARRVTFIEKDRRALEFLRQNVAKLGCEEATLIWPADVIRCSFRPRDPKGEFAPFEVIFFDPPYKLADALKEGTPLWRSLRRLARPEVSCAAATLVLRVPEKGSYEIPPEWGIDWTLEMSHMQIHVCTKQEVPEE